MLVTSGNWFYLTVLIKIPAIWVKFSCAVYFILTAANGSITSSLSENGPIERTFMFTMMVVGGPVGSEQGRGQ